MLPDSTLPDHAAAFETERGRLTGIAYRMLGSMADAEDIMQDAWLRWEGAAPDDVRKPGAYLSAIVTRLCLDRLKQARRHREIYVGPWLPEPVIADPASIGDHGTTSEKDISYALMLALERLSPLERAAFILFDVFDMPFGEIAPLLERSEQACRQLASRARGQIRKSRPRFDVPPDEAEKVAAAFFSASKGGDLDTLGRLLADDVALHSDGGGQKIAALNIIHGAPKVARFYAGLSRKPAYGPARWSRCLRINGLPAKLIVAADGTRQVTLVEIAGNTVKSVYVVRNPDKLERLWNELDKVDAI